jgi:hypothetical protein
MAYAAQRVAPHKKIRSVESVEQIPSHLPAKSGRRVGSASPTLAVLQRSAPVAPPPICSMKADHASVFLDNITCNFQAHHHEP